MVAERLGVVVQADAQDEDMIWPRPALTPSGAITDRTR